jgi:hypothetical protein
VREEPIISGAVVKAALVLLVAGALGVGGYALVGDGIDVDLPDLPDIETIGETTEAVTLEETTLEETAPEPPAAAPDPFTSTGFASALGQVRDAAGADAQLTRLTVNEVQTQFVVRRGDGVEAYSVRADDGELERADATITISGEATIRDFAFALDSVDPAAIDRMLGAARKRSGAADFEPSVLSLERAIPFGSRALGWTINARGGGRNLLYRGAGRVAGSQRGRLALPLLDQLLDPPVDAGRILLQPLHLEVAHADQLQAGGRGHGRAAHVVVEHPGLAEDVPRAELRDLLAFAAHLGGALLDREQLAGEAALGNDLRPLLHLLRLREGGHLLQLLVGRLREQRDPLQLRGVQSSSSPSIDRNLSQSRPTRLG